MSEKACSLNLPPTETSGTWLKEKYDKGGPELLSSKNEKKIKKPFQQQMVPSVPKHLQGC